MSGANPLFLREEELDRGIELLHQAHRRLAEEARALRETSAIDEIDQWALMMVARQPGTTLADIAAALGESKQTLSRRVRRLVDEGLLTQGETAGDRRKRPLGLSEVGRELVQRLTAAEKRRLRTAFKATGADAVEGFKAVVRELAADPRRPRAAFQAQGGRHP